MCSSVEYDLWYLAVLYRSAVVVASCVGKVEGHLASGRTLDADLTQTLRAVVRVEALQ